MFSGANLSGVIYSRVERNFRILWCSDGLRVTVWHQAWCRWHTSVCCVSNCCWFWNPVVFAKFRRNRFFSFPFSVHMLFGRHWCSIAVAGLDHTKWHGTYTCDSVQTYRRNRQYFLKDKQDFFLFPPWTDTCTWLCIWHRTCAKLLNTPPLSFFSHPFVYTFNLLYTCAGSTVRCSFHVSFHVCPYIKNWIHESVLLRGYTHGNLHTHIIVLGRALIRNTATLAGIRPSFILQTVLFVGIFLQRKRRCEQRDSRVLQWKDVLWARVIYKRRQWCLNVNCTPMSKSCVYVLVYAQGVRTQLWPWRQT